MTIGGLSTGRGANAPAGAPASAAPAARDELAGPQLQSMPAEVQAVWRQIGERPAYLEDVPSDAVKSVLELLVQDAERQTTRDRDTNLIYRSRYFARRLGTLLADSDRARHSPEERLRYVLADPYIAHVTPRLTVAQLDALIAHGEQQQGGPAFELAIHKVRDHLPAPEEVGGFFQTAPAVITPRHVEETHTLLLLARLVRTSPPTWTWEQIFRAYDDNLAAAGPDVKALPLSRDELELMLREQPYIRQDYEYQRFHFRERVKECIVGEAVGESMGRALRDLVRYHEVNVPGCHLSVSDVIAYIHGDTELQRLLNTTFAAQLDGPHVRVLPRLARWVRRIFGEDLHRFSLLEIADRMKQEDATFTPALVAELFARCPEILGETPDATTRRNFLVAVGVTKLMHAMYPGATYADVITLSRDLGPHGHAPLGLTVAQLELLQGYDFVPRWPNGVKPEASVRDSGRNGLDRDLAKPLRLLSENLGEALRKRAHAFLDERPAPTREVIEERVAMCFRPIAHRRAVALMEKWGGRLERLTVADILDALRDGRYDGLIDNPVWRTAFRVPFGSKENPAGQGVADQLLQLITDFRDAERGAAQAIELAVSRHQSAMAVLANTAQIPRVMPITAGVVDAVKPKQPFAGVRVVMIQHELGQAYCQVEAYRALGMDPKLCTFVGKPYHPNPEVRDLLVDVIGVNGRFAAQGDLEGMHRAACDAVDEVLANHVAGERVLIVCDGPRIRRYVEEKHFRGRPELAHDVVFTEQTAIGHRAGDVEDGTKRVVSYARLLQKLIEAPYVARSGIRAIERILFNLGDTLENKCIWLNGIGGPIGRATAEALIAAGARVEGFDINVTPELESWAKDHGIVVHGDDACLPDDIFMIAGAAGAQTINGAQIDKAARRRDGGPVYHVSLSSEYVEIDLAHLEKRATDAEGNVRKLVATMVNGQPTYYYWLDDGSVRVAMAGGAPVNFQGVNSVAPEVIDATMAMSIAAAAEAVEGTDLGFFAASKYVEPVSRGWAAYLKRSKSTPAR